MSDKQRTHTHTNAARRQGLANWERKPQAPQSSLSDFKSSKTTNQIKFSMTTETHKSSRTREDMPQFQTLNDSKSMNARTDQTKRASGLNDTFSHTHPPHTHIHYTNCTGLDGTCEICVVYRK
eukprot:Opistho-2@4882